MRARSNNLVFVIVTVSLVLPKTHCEDVDWCELSCKDGQNTACEYKGCLTRTHCQQISVSPEDKDYMLELHNEIRNEFAKTQTASNMRALSWDSNLEYVAQCWANQCPDVHSNKTHDVCRNTPRFNTIGAGQNMHAETGNPSVEDLAYNAIMQGWYVKEINKVPKEAFSKFNTKLDLPQGEKYGHATQILWADVTHVGCAVSLDDETEYTYLYCNYGPAGNVINQTVYEPGPPASECPEGVEANYEFENLCGEIEYASENSNNIFVSLYNDFRSYFSSIFDFII